MDFSATADRTAGHWLREAMRCVLRARPMRARPDASHHNNIPEICIVLEGRPILDIDNRRYALNPPRLGVLESGVRHSEGFARRACGYPSRTSIGN